MTNVILYCTLAQPGIMESTDAFLNFFFFFKDEHFTELKSRCGALKHPLYRENVTASETMLALDSQSPNVVHSHLTWLVRLHCKQMTKKKNLSLSFQIAGLVHRVFNTPVSGSLH